MVVEGPESVSDPIRHDNSFFQDAGGYLGICPAKRLDEQGGGTKVRYRMEGERYLGTDHGGKPA